MFCIALARRSLYFMCVRINSEKRLLALSCLFVCLSACISAAATAGIFVKFDIGDFYRSRGNPNFAKVGQQYGALGDLSMCILLTQHQVVCSSTTSSKGTLLCFRGNNGYANAPQYCVISTLLLLL
jgi:hypothetical protein